MLGYDGANLTRITQSSDYGNGRYEATNPILSSDGEWLLFESNAPIIDTDNLGVEQLYLLDLRNAKPEFYRALNQPPSIATESEPDPRPDPRPETQAELTLTQKPTTAISNSQCSPEPYCDTAGSINTSWLLLLLSLIILKPLRTKPALASARQGQRHV